MRACGFALALVVALGPIVLPWYALWGLVILAAVGRRIERGYAIIASVVLSIVVQPSGSSMPDVVLMAAVVVLSVLALAIAWRPVRRWIRSDLAVAIEEYRRARPHRAERRRAAPRRTRCVVGVVSHARREPPGAPERARRALVRARRD